MADSANSYNDANEDLEALITELFNMLDKNGKMLTQVN